MKEVSKFKMYNYLSLSWYFLVVLSVISILVLVFTDWRPVGQIANAERINAGILNLSYSIVSASMFYLFMGYLPTLSKRHIAKKYVSYQIDEIKEQLRCIVKDEFFLFNFERSLVFQFVSVFANANLGEPSLSDSKLSKYDSINKRLKVIVDRSKELLRFYLPLLKRTQLEFLNDLLCSEFARNGLQPIVWREDDGPLLGYPNNQNEVGRSIYKLYERSKIVES
jgi:hypothetical protein